MRRYLIPAAVAASVTLVAATPAPPSSIDGLTVARSGNTVTVEGTATFGDASTSIVGTDDDGDVSQAGIGADLVSATVSQTPSSETVTFTLGIADPIDPLFTIPEVVHYHWFLRVTNGTSSIYYLLQAMRSGQYERTLPSADPLFRVNSCGALASGAPSCFEVAGYVQGTMGGGIVQWHVPRALIGAFRGAVVEPYVTPAGAHRIEVVGGATGAAYGSPVFDRMEARPYVVGPSVAVGIRQAVDGPEFQVYDSSATLGPDGTFVAKVATPVLRGSYVVSARACNGDVAACGIAEAPLTVT